MAPHAEILLDVDDVGEVLGFPCGGCNRSMPIESFAFRRERGKLGTICRDCRRGYWRSYYERHKLRLRPEFNHRRANAQARNRAFISAYLLEHPCIDCGLLDPIVMEFDHVRGTKVREVSELVRDAAPIQRIIAEIEKCEVRCANCHRRKTFRTLWGREKRE